LGGKRVKDRETESCVCQGGVTVLEKKGGGGKIRGKRTGKESWEGGSRRVSNKTGQRGLINVPQEGLRSRFFPKQGPKGGTR